MKLLFKFDMTSVERYPNTNRFPDIEIESVDGVEQCLIC